ncbi:hypothetical protein N9V66_03120 [Amylibacter sp.]|nr:hypothetical protein [Amylibacter sp.]
MVVKYGQESMYHCAIVWPNSSEEEYEVILHHMERSFCVVDKQCIELQNTYEILHRFYDKSEKIIRIKHEQVGDGECKLLLLKSRNPHYKLYAHSDGPEVVNQRALDLKVKLRTLHHKNHIHMSLNQREFYQNILCWKKLYPKIHIFDAFIPPLENRLQLMKLLNKIITVDIIRGHKDFYDVQKSINDLDLFTLNRQNFDWLVQNIPLEIKMRNRFQWTLKLPTEELILDIHDFDDPRVVPQVHLNKITAKIDTVLDKVENQNILNEIVEMLYRKKRQYKSIDLSKECSAAFQTLTPTEYFIVKEYKKEISIPVIYKLLGGNYKRFRHEIKNFLTSKYAQLRNLNYVRRVISRDVLNLLKRGNSNNY